VRTMRHLGGSYGLQLQSVSVAVCNEAVICLFPVLTKVQFWEDKEGGLGNRLPLFVAQPLPI
jgi:hypothetical protein